MTLTLGKRFLSAIMLAGVLMTIPSEAQSPKRNRCEQRIRQAEYNLRKAIQRHGPRSKQARQRRRQLDSARERCGAL